MPTPEEQIVELLCSTDGDTSGLVAILLDACYEKVNLPTFIPMLMSGLSHDEKLDLVEELLIEKQQLSDSETVELAEDGSQILLAVTSAADRGLFSYRFNRDELTVRQFAILACDLVRVGAQSFNASVEDVWAMFDQERHDPEVKSRTLFAAPKSVGGADFFAQMQSRSALPAKGLPPLRLIDE